MKRVDARGLFRAMVSVLAVMLLAALTPGLCEEAAPAHNYILVIDNSRSTTGRHSLGEATDPRGLRFDAARLVYQNVLSSGRSGQIGVIVFCGSKNCVTYGPLDIQSPDLDAVIGDNLNAAANQKRRDDYTDIRTALETAQGMLAQFEGRTSVILLTDGVNDLTNRPNPFTRPENTEANDRSVEIAEAISAAGADFHVIALTTRQDVSADDPFMAFINRLAKAGGGVEISDGDYDNVLVTTQADLNSSLLQMLIKAESESETIQTVVEYTPVYAPFTVPYAGITDATVNITFMPEDKRSLKKIELVAPDGAAHTLWEDGAAQALDGIAVTEDRSYIMLDVPSPQPGEWKVAISAKKDAADHEARVLTNAIVRFNHNLRVKVDAPETVYMGDPMSIAAWFQSFAGESYEDLTGSEIYDQSSARVILITPDEKKWSGGMKNKGDRYEVSIAPKIAGAWRAQIRVSNPHVQETSEEVRFEVIERPTPEPTATPSPTPIAPVVTNTPTPSPTPSPSPTPIPTVKPVESVKLKIMPLIMRSNGNFIHSDGKRITVTWKADSDAELVSAELLEDGKFLRNLESGDRINPAELREDAQYEVRVSVMPQFGMINGVEPYTESIAFRLMPKAGSVKRIALSVDPLVDGPDGASCIDPDAQAVTLSWTVDGETESETGALLENGEHLRDITSGESIECDVFREDAEYTFSVTAMPKNGTALGAKPVTNALTFRRYPASQPIEGLTLDVADGKLTDGVYRLKDRKLNLSWRIDSGDVERYALTITGGDSEIRERFDGKRNSYSFQAEKAGDYAVALTATPRYARDDGESVTVTAVVRPHVPGFIEKYWPFGAGLLALVAVLIAVLLFLRAGKAERVNGRLRVVCAELELDEMLIFTDGRKGVKSGSPLTAHSALAKLKGKRAYRLLSGVRVSNALANNLGRANCRLNDPDVVERVKAVQHRPNEHLIELIYTDAKRGRQDACYVGKFDIGESVITMDDGGQKLQFVFTSR